MKEILGGDNLIDIHSHIIFGVDDGPQTIEESRSLLMDAYNQGVRTIVATSHRRIGMFETPEDRIEKNFKTVHAIETEFDDDTNYFVSQAKKRNIFTIKDLELVSHSDYKNLWIDFCDRYFNID